jgi:thiaminase (transcriptional activator TenA)
LGRPVVATSACESLRAGCRDLWQGLLAHPFVLELAAATLPLAKFRRYLRQDLVFLEDYAAAIAIAVARADRPEDRILLIEELQIVVGSEVDAQRGQLESVEQLLGVEPAPAPAPARATVGYGSFLIATAARGDALDVMAALMPCAWSYAEIGVLYARDATEHPVYADWLRFFGGDDYLRSIEQRRAIFDSAAADAAPARWARLSELFATATRFEQAFWDMAYSEEEET